VSAASPEDELWASVTPDAARRLLLAGLECFAAIGVDATTTRDISRRAGMSPAAMYTHYPSKADLLFRVSSTGHEAVWHAVEEALRTADAPPERVAAFVRAFTSWHARHHRFARVAQLEMRGLEPRARREVLDLRRLFQPVLETDIRRGIELGLLAPVDVTGTARALLSLGIDTARWYRPGGDDTPEGVGDLYAALALRMLGGSPLATP
jgi:AcrR family transcriptional regulator